MEPATRHPATGGTGGGRGNGLGAPERPPARDEPTTDGTYHVHLSTVVASTGVVFRDAVRSGR